MEVAETLGQIVGIIELGLMLKPSFPIGITLASSITLRSGFLLDVPQSSQIILNVSDLGLSHVTGLQDTVITPLPFSAEAENLNMTLFTGFQPRLVLTASANANRFESMGLQESRCFTMSATPATAAHQQARQILTFRSSQLQPSASTANGIWGSTCRPASWITVPAMHKTCTATLYP